MRANSGWPVGERPRPPRSAQTSFGRRFKLIFLSDPRKRKAVLHHYLQVGREALLWKLEGLGERELRMPRTPTGTNLIGIVKHMANGEIDYFGDAFGREWPTPGERVDGAVGVHPKVSNLPEQQDCVAYVAMLTALAERF